MEPFKYHVYMCTQQKPEGIPGCAAHGSEAVLNVLRAEVMKAGLDDEVQVTTCGSLGLCERGPNMVVYPEGVWYSKVQAADVPEIVREHFQGGRPVARLMNTEVAAVRTEIQENRRKARAAMAAQKKG